MGACGTKVCGARMSQADKELAKISKKIDKKQALEQAQEAKQVKLLLLGAGESGKSTIFKQMKQLYGSGFDDASRQQLAPIVRSNLLYGLKIVLENCGPLDCTLQTEEAKAAAEVITSVEDDVLDEERANAATTLWKDEQFQKCWSLRSKYQIFDGFSSFVKRACDYPEWGGPDWIPDINDVLAARVRTSGIVEEEYVIQGITFRMYDVGGQRNERKKWIHCFENVTAVIFVGAISEYDQVLFEDKTTNRLLEAINLFDDISNSRWFQTTSQILFLNKRDLFQDKFCGQKIPLNKSGIDLFATAPVIDWDKTTDEEAFEIATKWILDRFLEKAGPSKEIYHHITCATDSNNVSTVFNACNDIILKNNLASSGFME